ncbi:hypothetical protein BX666DRAFT_173574 [Dichotomocladium elegans]|nr:hypothetical protein BX666DRAFT_173574 [Dichotomocladium elegans]
MLAKSIVAKEEDARRKMEQASESKQIENQNLLGRVAAIRKELIASKDRNKILYSNNRKLDSKLSELTSNYEQATIREIQNKGLIKNLEDRIKSLVTQNDNMCKSLRDTQEKNRQLEESHRNHSYQLITEKDAIARENDTLRSRITELLLQVQDNSSRADMATHQFEEARRGRDRLHDQFNKMKALYNSSVETYKRSAACSKEELEQVKATLEETKLSAQDTQRNLEDELDTLKQAYTECESRLHVALNRLRSIAKDPSEFEVSEERADYITTLISQYERSTNKDWEEVYEDFFDLREKHTRTLIENKSLKSMNDDLVKEVHTLRDQDRVVKSHCSELQTENASLRDQASHLKAANHQSKEKIEELQQKMATLTQSNEELDRSLRNTTYQFRYLIRDVQCRNEILPPGIDECNDLASYISITPTEAHEKIVFRDVDELQKRNQELLNIAAELRHNLDNRLNELNQLKQSYHDLQEQHSKEKQSYNDKLNSVTRQIEILETSIQEVTNERDTLKKVVADHVRMTSRAVNLELQRELEVCKEKLVTMENEMKSERTEASEEIGRIQARVAEAEEVVKEARSEYEQTRTRAKQLAEEASRLTIDLQSAKLEIQNLTDHVQTAQTQLLDQAAVIQQLQADLTSEQHARATLHQQKTSIETQLEYQQQLTTMRGVRGTQLTN